MEYLLLKHLHMTLAASSIALFALRGGGRIFAPHYLQQRWVRVLPHLIDTLLLASGVGLAAWAHFYPWQQGWLAIKLGLLVAYIVAGSMALKRAQTRRGQVAMTLVALVCVVGIVVLATQKP